MGYREIGVGVLTVSVNKATVGCNVASRGFGIYRFCRVPSRTGLNKSRLVLGILDVMNACCNNISYIKVDATNRIGSRRNEVVFTGRDVPRCANARVGGVVVRGCSVPIIIRGSMGSTTATRTVFNDNGNSGSFLYLACKAKINKTI